MTKLLKNKKLLTLVIIVALVVIALVSSFVLYTIKTSPVGKSDDLITFEIAQGETSDVILSNLKEQGLIKDPTMAKICMKVNGLSDLKSGVFYMKNSMDTKAILTSLNDINQASHSSGMITFREGLWAKDMAILIEQKTGINHNELITLWNDETYIRSLMDKYPFINEDMFREGLRVKLEGYLFPETYTFTKDASAEEITETFLDHFAIIYEKYADEIRQSGMSIQEVITFASVVQYEASKIEDMKMIAGVFNNRLAAGMKLQSSVTICYALYDDLTNGEECEVNPDIDSPYNTYVHEGFPVGPILNPGEEAIEAVLHPTANDYLYFVADIYGDGSVHYAKTYEEQLQNQERFNLNK